VVGLLLSLLAACGIIGAMSSNSTSGSGNCYEQAGQDMLKREGNKAMNQSDMDRYHSELKSRCG
jgi:hypothetical protein